MFNALRFARLAAHQHLAARDDRHARTQVGDVLDDVRRQDHDGLTPEFSEQIEEPQTLGRIEATGRGVFFCLQETLSRRGGLASSMGEDDCGKPDRSRPCAS